MLLVAQAGCWYSKTVGFANSESNYHNSGGELGSHISCLAFRNPDPLETSSQTVIDVKNFTVPLTCGVNIYVQGKGNHGLGSTVLKVTRIFYILNPEETQYEHKFWLAEGHSFQ
jgi:hypothetical protein